MSPDETTIPARAYLRVSFDKHGNERSNDEQLVDIESAGEATRPRWVFGEPYRDTGSASRRARKARDDFDKLLADLDAGRFDAELLVLWESSRGSRRVSEWVALIEACERAGVRIAVTTHGPRIYDPANPRDRRSLIDDANDSEYEAAKLSERVLRASRANAANGRPHGRPPYGYRHTFDPTTGRLDRREPVADEAAFVVEAFQRVAGGHSLRSVATDLAGRGMVGRQGAPISAAGLRPMLLNPAYVGQRVHAPSATRAARLRGSGDGVSTTDADWPPLVDTETFLAVRSRLTDPARRTSRPGRGVHLLSMIVVCDVCDGPLSARFRDGARFYFCHRAQHVRVRADELDRLVERELLDYLRRPENVERLEADPDLSDEVAAAKDEVARVSAELDDLADQVGAGVLSATLAARAEPAILARLADARARLDELTTPSALGRLVVVPGGDVEQHWKDAPMAVKREIVRLLLVPEWLGELRVTRSPVRNRPVPVAERVEWRPQRPRRRRAGRSRVK